MRPPQNFESLTVRFSLPDNSPTLQLEAQLGTENPQTGVSYVRLELAQVAQMTANLSWMSLRSRVVDSGGKANAESSVLSGDPLQELGKQLFSLLFEGDLGALYSLVLSAESEGRITRLYLEPQTESLVTLPWELLFSPARTSFFALSPRTPLMRRRPDAKFWTQPLATSEPLKVLLIEADCLGLFDPSEDELMMKELETRFSGRIKMSKPVQKATWEKIAAALVKDRYDIVHLSGTGNFIPEDTGGGVRQGAVYFESDKPVSWEEFGGMLSKAQPRLVVLSTDYSAPFARELARGVPLVVGVQRLIASESMEIFEKNFYATLLGGTSFEIAVTRGRQAVDTENTGVRDWGLIVAYAHAEDSRLVAEDSPFQMLSALPRSIPSAEDAPEGEADKRKWTRLARLIGMYEANLASLNQLSGQALEASAQHDVEKQIELLQKTLKDLKLELKDLD